MTHLAHDEVLKIIYKHVINKKCRKMLGKLARNNNYNNNEDKKHSNSGHVSVLSKFCPFRHECIKKKEKKNKIFRYHKKELFTISRIRFSGINDSFFFVIRKYLFSYREI